MSNKEMTRAFSAGFSAGVSAGMTMGVMDVDASTEPYIVEAISRAQKEQGVEIEVDHDVLTAIIKNEEGL